MFYEEAKPIQTKEIDKYYSFEEAKQKLRDANLPNTTISRAFMYKYLKSGQLELNYIGVKSFIDWYKANPPKVGRPNKY